MRQANSERRLRLFSGFLETIGRSFQQLLFLLLLLLLRLNKDASHEFNATNHASIVLFTSRKSLLNGREEADAGATTVAEVGAARRNDEFVWVAS